MSNFNAKYPLFPSSYFERNAKSRIQSKCYQIMEESRRFNHSASTSTASRFSSNLALVISRNTSGGGYHSCHRFKILTFLPLLIFNEFGKDIAPISLPKLSDFYSQSSSSTQIVSKWKVSSGHQSLSFVNQTRNTLG